MDATLYYNTDTNPTDATILFHKETQKKKQKAIYGVAETIDPSTSTP